MDGQRVKTQGKSSPQKVFHQDNSLIAKSVESMYALHNQLTWH
jgi:hypothetical protein